MAEQIQTTYHLICYSLLSLSALAALTGHQNRPQSSQQTHEMTVPNELIGCIIGKGGSKIAEIRYEYCMKLDTLLRCHVHCHPKVQSDSGSEIQMGQKGLRVLTFFKL